MMHENITLAHGGGGRLSRQLTEELFLPILGNRYLLQLNDSAVVEPGEGAAAFTTDAFVVDPVFFPGGDIGRLAVCGTVNDLAVMGALPRYLSAAFILEEGYPLADLRRIVRSMKDTADEAEVTIVTGDTKVVPRGAADSIFITTAGIGYMNPGMPVSAGRAHPGDAVIISGPVGRHGMAIMTSREGLGFSSTIESDVAPLNRLTAAMLEVTGDIHVMRDATRGGLATVLNEIASQAACDIILEERSVPVTEAVRGACELLGFDPLYVANEGVLVACAAADAAGALLEAMRGQTYGTEAVIAGRVGNSGSGRVVLETEMGSRRVLDMLSGEQLPRIC
ncbi:hydrogenase expression/formation protein HypE [bacterium]|nr:hydrogenase expression/formation protein HypE [bacterium]